MPRLCSESSRSYPGRPVRHAVNLTALYAATHRVTGQESAEVIVGVGETSRDEIDAEDSPHRRTELRAGEEPQ